MPASFAPATDAKPITPNDAQNLSPFARSLLIGSGGDLHVVTMKNRNVVLPNVPAGVLPLGVKKVFDDQTTASDISALY